MLEWLPNWECDDPPKDEEAPWLVEPDGCEYPLAPEEEPECEPPPPPPRAQASVPERMKRLSASVKVKTWAKTPPIFDDEDVLTVFIFACFDVGGRQEASGLTIDKRLLCINLLDGMPTGARSANGRSGRRTKGSGRWTGGKSGVGEESGAAQARAAHPP